MSLRQFVKSESEKTLSALIPEVVSEIGAAARQVDARVREGRFQKWLALVAGLSSALGGLEVSYMHYRGSYSRRIMYTPVVLGVALLGAGVWAFRSGRIAKTVLPAVSGLTLLDCAIGTYFHVRGIQRKPGGCACPWSISLRDRLYSARYYLALVHISASLLVFSGVRKIRW